MPVIKSSILDLSNYSIKHLNNSAPIKLSKKSNLPIKLVNLTKVSLLVIKLSTRTGFRAQHSDRVSDN